MENIGTKFSSTICANPDYKEGVSDKKDKYTVVNFQIQSKFTPFIEYCNYKRKPDYIRKTWQFINQEKNEKGFYEYINNLVEVDFPKLAVSKDLTPVAQNLEEIKALKDAYTFEDDEGNTKSHLNKIKYLAKTVFDSDFTRYDGAVIKAGEPIYLGFSAGQAKKILERAGEYLEDNPSNLEPEELLKTVWVAYKYNPDSSEKTGIHNFRIPQKQDIKIEEKKEGPKELLEESGDLPEVPEIKYESDIKPEDLPF